jgi:hypothetical protein
VSSVTVGVLFTSHAVTPEHITCTSQSNRFYHQPSPGEAGKTIAFHRSFVCLVLVYCCVRVQEKEYREEKLTWLTHTHLVIASVVLQVQRTYELDELVVD